MTNKPDALPVVAFKMSTREMDEPLEVCLYSEHLAAIARRDAELSELRQSIEGTTGYKYRAELYDEVWQKSRDMGYGNVTMALDDIAAFKASRDTLQAELAAMREQKPIGWRFNVIYKGELVREGTAWQVEKPKFMDLPGTVFEYSPVYADLVSAPSQVVRPAVSPSFPNDSRYTYCTTQATECAGCGVRKHTPLRVDWMGGYVCLTCIDNKLDELNSAEDAEVVQVPEFLKSFDEFLERVGRIHPVSLGAQPEAEKFYAELRALLATSQGKA